MSSVEKIKTKFNIDISFVAVRDHCFSAWKTTGHFSSAVYLRLLIPDLIREKKIIYLDSDTLVLGDLSGLYEIDVAHQFIAGVEDINKGKNSNVPRATDDIYINSGVMLMNLEGLREDDFLNKCRNIYSIFQNSITLVDQCIINKYAEMRKISIEPKWNRQILSNRVKKIYFSSLILKENSTVIHFIGETKPWSQWCSPTIAEFWWGYASKLNLQDLKPDGISNVSQLINLAMVLDFGSEPQRSISREKSNN